MIHRVPYTERVNVEKSNIDSACATSHTQREIESLNSGH